jgi:hypothetical protein
VELIARELLYDVTSYNINRHAARTPPRRQGMIHDKFMTHPRVTGELPYVHASKN